MGVADFDARAQAKWAALVLTAGLGIVSMGQMGWSTASPWFITFWQYFAGGVLCYWTITRTLPWWTLAVYLACFLGGAIWDNDPARWMGLATLLAVWGVGAAGKLEAWSGGRVLIVFWGDFVQLVPGAFAGNCRGEQRGI